MSNLKPNTFFQKFEVLMEMKGANNNVYVAKKSANVFLELFRIKTSARKNLLCTIFPKILHNYGHES